MTDKNIGILIEIKPTNTTNSNIIGFQNNEPLNINNGKPKSLLSDIFSKLAKWLAGFSIKK